MLPPWLKILNDFPLHLNKAYTKPERLILSYRTLKGSCGLSNLSCTKFFLVSWNPLPPDLSIAGSYLSLRSQLYVTSLERSSLTNLTLSHSIMLKVFHFYIIQHPQIPSYLYLLFFSSPQNTSYTIITQRVQTMTDTQKVLTNEWIKKVSMEVTLGIATALGEKTERMAHRIIKGFENHERKILRH